MRYIISVLGILTLIWFVSCQQNITQPDEQFLKLHYRYGYGNELNTYTQHYTKDLVLDGYVTVEFWLTTKEQQEIIDKMEAVDFMSLPDTIATHLQGDSIVVAIVPNPGRQFILAEYHGNSKEVSWYLPLPEDNSASEAIRE